MGKKLVIQAAGLGGAGLVCAYFFNLSTAQINLSTAQTISETLRTLGNISAISGSLVGWSVGWLSQSRTGVKDIDYDAAEDLFNHLGCFKNPNGLWKSCQINRLMLAKTPHITDIFTLFA